MGIAANMSLEMLQEGGYFDMTMQARLRLSLTDTSSDTKPMQQLS